MIREPSTRQSSKTGTVRKGTPSKTASYGGGLHTQDAAYNITTQTWLDEAAAFHKLV